MTHDALTANIDPDPCEAEDGFNLAEAEFSRPPNILVVDSKELSAQMVRSKVSERLRGARVVTALVDTPQRPASPCPDVDVILVHLSPTGVSELAYAVHLLETANGASVAYWAEQATSPQVCAAAAIGIEKVVPADRLWEWMSQALRGLVLRARARRVLRTAERSVPPVPDWTDGTELFARLPLSQAETLFRESYLKRLLAETSSIRRAAELAGVPYRTFYDMLKKLDLR